ncbi:aldo/keto reductase [Texcoconibacillus texcoconensis]|uniref:Aryl-alcohol dehydrogenase-like predicted oxidoreductase n=1 Tax=Texcoconibacillus texcoconensis TaxID=1095777 RepID=A0A840QU35_9BACI|nr:aldo/keto reductase [Texcoconibacillus texcoconensis]MBB5174860.1 aryl-alcohol dehydrogenase-like predicted oxidoreductase [Texcoconibacillus texcoconensis]
MTIDKKIVLGTDVFGLPLGGLLGDGDEKREQERLLNILKTASEKGINFCDTGVAYGDSEGVLAKAISSHDEHPWRITTKLPIFRSSVVNEEMMNQLYEAWRCTRQRFSTEQIYGVYLENVDDLEKPGAERLMNWWYTLKTEIPHLKIGVKVDSIAQLKRAFESFAFQLVQIPLNIFDQRFHQSGMIKQLKENGVDIHIYSSLPESEIQKPLETLPNSSTTLMPHIEQFHDQLQEKEISPITAALMFPLSIEEVDRFVIQIENVEQLKDLFKKWPNECIDFPFDKFSLEGESLRLFLAHSKM